MARTRLGRRFGEKEVRSLLERGTKLLLAHDPLGEIVLGLLVRAQPKAAAEALVARAVRFRKQRKFAEAIALLAFLAASGQIDAEGRYQLALARLLLDSSQTHEDSQTAGDATMVGVGRVEHVAGLVAEDTLIEFADPSGRWITERADGHDRPEVEVEG